MDTITIRQAVLADLPALAMLFDSYRQFYGQSSDVAGARAFLQARFEHGQSVAFIAHDASGQAFGFTQLYPTFSSISMRRALVLNDLFVTPDARGQGVGRQLLAAAREYGQAIGAAALSLATAQDNTQAQALYEADGWQRDVQFLHYRRAL
ncbi:GNAT family N-acetyltransferase [Vandammella animalimorsus]|uniref:GNAT family N-acetyltransferase n=1 Tax=Vandammella animalimorsus TaxID=2029117 RepID=UPI0031BA8B93